MNTEQQVAALYGRAGLERAILDALSASGKKIDKLAPSDLSGVDEFHLGWRAATIEFARELGLSRGMRVLDIGSGIGGPARYFAEVHGCRVTGVDLTEEYVQVADALTRRCGLADHVLFKQASALALPFAEDVFDAATLTHVGMNIGDKARLFAEVRRVLRRGARFGIYDLMRASDGEISYPMPWATTVETSFVEPPETYRRLLAAAGFEVEKERNRCDAVLRLWREMRDNAAKQGAPPLGLHILMGPATPQRLGNAMSALERGIIAPIEIVARAV